MDHIGINRILFDHSEWVTLWGFRLIKGRKTPMDYLITFDQLNKLLRISGKEGDRIQMLIVEKLESGIEEPSVVDLEAVFGQPAFFNQCILEVSSTWTETETGALEEDKQCLSIDAVYPLLGKRQQALARKTAYRHTLLECENILAKAYEQYLGYLELDMGEEAALQLAGLDDDLKFKMAYCAWKMDQKAA